MIILCRADVVGGGGGGDSTLVDLVSTESQGEGVRGVVMDKVRPDICGEAFEESPTEKETRLVTSW